MRLGKGLPSLRVDGARTSATGSVTVVVGSSEEKDVRVLRGAMVEARRMARMRTASARRVRAVMMVLLSSVVRGRLFSIKILVYDQKVFASKKAEECRAHLNIFGRMCHCRR